MKKSIILIIAVMVSFATFAQTGKSKMPVTKSITTQQVKYTCSMHPEIVSNKPGKCSKCGMDLTKIKKYTCSMHPEVVSNKPGKCPKCGMDLTEVKTKSKAKKA